MNAKKKKTKLPDYSPGLIKAVEHCSLIERGTWKNIKKAHLRVNGLFDSI